MALPLIFMLGGTFLRAAGPTIARELAKLGAKKATKQALKNAPKNIRTITNKNIKNVKKPTTQTKKVDTKKTPTKQTKKVDKKKKTDTKKTVAGSSTVPKVIGALGGYSVLTSALMKNKDGSAKAGALPTRRPKSIKPKDFGMGMVDDFGKGRRKTGDMEGGTAPIKPKPKAKATPKMKEMPKKKSKPITAGSNVGFGPKGNIYPKDAADRKRLMNKYGGTGSAAAKAAAQGKQGSLKKVGST